jgi:hypothetical protein
LEWGVQPPAAVLQPEVQGLLSGSDAVLRSFDDLIEQVTAASSTSGGAAIQMTERVLQRRGEGEWDLLGVFGAWDTDPDAAMAAAGLM